MQALQGQGVDELYIKVLEDIHEDNLATIKCHRESKKIPVNVRQGDTLFQNYSRFAV